MCSAALHPATHSWWTPQHSSEQCLFTRPCSCCSENKFLFYCPHHEAEPARSYSTICSLYWQGLSAFQSSGHFITTPLPFSSIIVENKTFLFPDWSLTNSISHLPRLTTPFWMSFLITYRILKRCVTFTLVNNFSFEISNKHLIRSPLINFIVFSFFFF